MVYRMVGVCGRSGVTNPVSIISYGVCVCVSNVWAWWVVLALSNMGVVWVLDPGTASVGVCVGEGQGVVGTSVTSTDTITNITITNIVIFTSYEN